MPSSKPSRMSRWLILCISILSLCLIFSTLLFAQSTGGRILGRVADSSGAVLAGVKVTAHERSHGGEPRYADQQQRRLRLSPSSGRHLHALVRFEGIQDERSQGNRGRPEPGDHLEQHLQVGETKETVEVTSEAPLVDTTSTQLGAVMDSRQVSNLPLNSRDTYQLLQLQPGVMESAALDRLWK